MEYRSCDFRLDFQNETRKRLASIFGNDYKKLTQVIPKSKPDHDVIVIEDKPDPLPVKTKLIHPSHYHYYYYYYEIED